MRIVDADEAVASLGDGQTIFVHGGAATPATLLAALAARAPRLTGVTTVGLHLEGPSPYLEPSMAGHLRHRGLGSGACGRAAVNAGRAQTQRGLLCD
jgi:4-hydroxybutyrate CoA-transferase